MARASRGDSYMAGAGANPGRVRFVSRSAQQPQLAPDSGPLRDADGRALPGLRERDTWLLLGFVACLQAIAWWMLEGYQLADSVEYMERALTFTRREEMIDSKAIRSFGFSSLLVPFFAVTEWLNVQDLRPLVSILRLFQVVLGLALVLVCARLGARLGGRGTGLAAGFFAGCNPIFLQYTVSPVSGIAAALFVALGLEAVIERGNTKRSVLGGLWFGLAFLMAYKTIIITLPVLGMVFLRDRLRHRASTLGISGGIFLAMLLQIGMDKLIYGAWGASLSRYLVENVGSVLPRILYELGFVDAAKAVYEAAGDLHGDEPGGRTAQIVTPRQRQAPLWYLFELPRMLVWPVMVFGALGLLRAWKRMNWKIAILVVVLLVNVLLMSFKGSKSFRLWIPLLPMIAPLAAYGWNLVYGGGPLFSGLTRKLAATALLVTSLVLGLDTLLALNTRRFGVYWEAMRIVNAESERMPLELDEEGEPVRWRASAAYHWAVYLRESPQVELVKLPHHLDSWNLYTDEERAEDLEEIRSLDWFITHLPVLGLDPALMAAVNEHFEIHSAHYHGDVYEGLGPIFLLRRKGLPLAGSAAERGRPVTGTGRTFFEVARAGSSVAWRERQLSGRAIPFERHFEDGHTERITLRGFEYEDVPGDDYGWITYHWHAETDVSVDYTLIDRLSAHDERDAWQNNHSAAYGSFPTSLWRAGTDVRESYLVVPAADPYEPQGPRKWTGGAFRRGDLIPVRLWMQVARFDPESGAIVGRMDPLTVPGLVLSNDGLARVGGLLLPTHPDARLADDGQPLE